MRLPPCFHRNRGGLIPNTCRKVHLTADTRADGLILGSNTDGTHIHCHVELLIQINLLWTLPHIFMELEHNLWHLRALEKGLNWL